NSYVYVPNLNSFDCPPDSYNPPHPTYETYSYDSYRNDSQFGYDCQPQFLLNYEPEPGYIENYNSYPYDSSSLPQQYPCCTHCGGPHMKFQCQPMNQDSYNSNSLGFDQPQPLQYPVIHQPPQELCIQEMENLKQQYLDKLKRLSNLEYRDENKIAELTENFNEASPPDSELVSSEVMEIVIPEGDILLLEAFLYDDHSFDFKVEPNSMDFTKDVVEVISPTTEPQVLNAFSTHPSLQLNMKFQPSSESLFTYVVWIFLPFLVYSVAPHYLLSLRNEDTIFDPGICSSHFSRPALSHRCGTITKFNTHRSHLNECPMLINGKNTPILDVSLFHFYPP
nr:hypothetical protein [Tanacetum cinerariifolium]